MNNSVKPISFVAALLAFPVTPVAPAAIIPKGYELIRITDNSTYERNPRINSAGQVVFASREWIDDHGDIYLWSAGELIRLTNDEASDFLPAISDSGLIAWSRAVGPEGEYGPTSEIALLEGNEMSLLTDNDVDDYVGDINSAGKIVGSRWPLQGGDADLMLYERDGEQTLIANQYSIQSPRINEAAVVVATEYGHEDDEGKPYSVIIRVEDGAVEVVSSPETSPQIPDINNTGLISFRYSERDENDEWLNVIDLWRNGERERFTDWGLNARINDHGDMYFIRWYEEDRVYQAWAYLRGEFVQLSDDPYWNTDGDINNRTDIVWESGGHPDKDIILLRRLPFGDMNCDKSVDFADIDGFVVALVSGKDAFTEQFPDCDWWLADMNDDRSIDFNDLDPFIACLTNGGCER